MATTVSLKPNAVEISGSTSGTTTLQATAVAGTTTLTLPAATDTLVGKATTDTLTNKTLTSPTISGVATFAAGTAALPAITTTGDLNTGIWCTANGVGYLDGSKVLTTGSALVFDGSNLGVGVTPSAWDSSFKVLQLANGTSLSNNGQTSYYQLGANNYFDGTNYKYIASNYAGFHRFSNLGDYEWHNAPSGTAGNTISFTQAMTLDASGNLLVGTTSDLGAKVNVSSGTRAWAGWFQQVNNAGNSVVMVEYSTGAPNNTGDYFGLFRDTGGQRIQLRSNGGIANYTANDVNLSDRREKTNFAPAGSYLDKICAIPVQTFNYIDQNMEEDGGLTLGVVAQDVQAIAPELVMESNWGTEEEPKMRLSIYQTDLQYALMKALQEQQALITQLTARITALESA